MREHDKTCNAVVGGPCVCGLDGGPVSVYCGSEIAIQVAAAAYPENDARKLADALIAVHHPKLGLDRSVCLRDVVEALREEGGWMTTSGHFLRPAAFVEQKFGRGGPDSAA